jgi:demethylmenaquinone methyltransferase/2-methoxy-6-polyprenyl-1,4-benzoquinol methylase
MSYDSASPQLDPESLAGSKRARAIRSMFDAISPTYDFLNHLLSANIDRLWRRRLARHALSRRPQRILDVCTGTGDVLMELARQAHKCGCAPVCVGTDFSRRMLERAARKKLGRRAGGPPLQLAAADTLHLPFRDATFDLVTVAFGIRNVEDLRAALIEMARVTRPHGQVAILEFSKPRLPVVRQLYSFYFTRVLPWLGRIVSGTKAYIYLPKSVLQFPEGQALLDEMAEAGWHELHAQRFTGGIATLYLGTKKAPAS